MDVQFQELFNSYLDKLSHSEIHAFHRSWSAYRVWGIIGAALLTIVGVTMAIYIGLAPLVIAILILCSAMTFFGLALATKILIGEERIVYYHHEIAILLVTTIVLTILQQPILPYLDMTIIGMGIFLFCGRIGCLMVGCCHGKPYNWGVCYREEHAIAGFTNLLVGVRLFPIQAIESIYVLGNVIVCSYLVIEKFAPGETLCWYLTAYNIGRFFFEFMRGDTKRPYLCGFSEAQWISVLLMCIVVWAELYGFLPFRIWHIYAAAGLVLAMIVVAAIRFFRETAKHELVHPRHVLEVAEAIELVSNPPMDEIVDSRWNTAPAVINLARTSLGVQISTGKVKSSNGCIDHYTISAHDGVMHHEAARTIADLISRLKLDSGVKEIFSGKQGVYHFFILPKV